MARCPLWATTRVRRTRDNSLIYSTHKHTPRVRANAQIHTVTTTDPLHEPPSLTSNPLGLTSAEFVARYSDKYAGAKPSYHGAAQWGAGSALVKSIELAGTLQTSKVSEM